MPRFDFTFVVNAPLTAVALFHQDTRVLQQLTPPPVIVQIHLVEPLMENSVAEFTLWFGPMPIHWVAVHQNVDPLHGFTDVQRSGPLKYWAHTHTFIPISETITRITEKIEFEHHPDWRGRRSRALFSLPALTALFTYRKLITRRTLKRSS